MTMQIVERQVFALPTPPKMVVQGMDAQRSIVEISQALSAMADAALVGDDAVKIVAAKSFAAFTPGGSTSVFERSGEDWRADGRLVGPEVFQRDDAERQQRPAEPRRTPLAGALRDKGERVGRNPKTGIEVPIAPRRVMTFRASQIMRDRVAK